MDNLLLADLMSLDIRITPDYITDRSRWVAYIVFEHQQNSGLSTFRKQISGETIFELLENIQAFLNSIK